MNYKNYNNNVKFKNLAEWQEQCRKEPGFPIWKYHKDKLPDGKIVYSAEELKDLGEGWVDSPADFDKKSKKVEKPVEKVDDLPNEDESKEELEESQESEDESESVEHSEKEEKPAQSKKKASKKKVSKKKS